MIIWILYQSEDCYLERRGLAIPSISNIGQSLFESNHTRWGQRISARPDDTKCHWSRWSGRWEVIVITIVIVVVIVVWILLTAIAIVIAVDWVLWASTVAIDGFRRDVAITTLRLLLVKWKLGLDLGFRMYNANKKACKNGKYFTEGLHDVEDVGCQCRWRQLLVSLSWLGPFIAAA